MYKKLHIYKIFQILQIAKEHQSARNVKDSNKTWELEEIKSSKRLN